MDYNKREKEIYIRESVLCDYYQIIDKVNPLDDSNILPHTVHLYDVMKILDDVGIKENTENGYSGLFEASNRPLSDIETLTGIKNMLDDAQRNGDYDA